MLVHLTGKDSSAPLDFISKTEKKYLHMSKLDSIPRKPSHHAMLELQPMVMQEAPEEGMQRNTEATLMK